jgi:DNA-binding LacI/PurR family transcriptional regulator
VAYILNGGPEHITFSPETRALVETAARELGYRPSVAAQATATGRTGCIALLHAGGPLPEDLLWSIHDRLAHHGLSLGLARMPDPLVVDQDYVPRVLAAWMADGVLITADRPLPAAVLKAIPTARIPALVVGLAQPLDAVHADDEGAGREATQHLLRLGHRRIVFVDCDPQSPAEIARHAGYAGALRVAGLRPRSLCGADESALNAAMAKADRPTAVLIADDPALTLAAAQRATLSVPRDLSVIAFGIRPWQEPGLAVVTHVVPWAAVGRTAVDQLQARLGDPDRHLPAVALAGHLVPGASVAAPTGGARGA